MKLSDEFRFLTFEKLKEFAGNITVRTEIMKLSGIVCHSSYIDASIDDRTILIEILTKRLNEINSIVHESALFQFLSNSLEMLQIFMKIVTRANFIKSVHEHDLERTVCWMNKKFASFDDFLKIKNITEEYEPSNYHEADLIKKFFNTIGQRDFYLELYCRIPKKLSCIRLNQIFVSLYPVVMLEKYAEYGKVQLSARQLEQFDNLIRIRMGENYEIIPYWRITSYFYFNTVEMEVPTVLSRFCALFWKETLVKRENKEETGRNWQVPAFVMMDSLYLLVGRSAVFKNNAHCRTALNFIRDCPKEYMDIIIEDQQDLKVKSMIIKVRALFEDLKYESLQDTGRENLFAEMSKYDVGMLCNFITNNGRDLKLLKSYFSKTTPEIAKANMKYLIENFKQADDSLKACYKEFCSGESSVLGALVLSPSCKKLHEVVLTIN